jgi:Mrp family chromosome partitioning ATPase
VDQEISFLDKLGDTETVIRDDNISSEYSSKAPLITFRYRGKIYPKVNSDFKELIKKYVDIRLILQAGQKREIQYQPDSFEVYILEQLEKLTQKKEQLQEEICRITEQRNLVGARSITKEKWLAKKQPKSFPLDFEKSISQYIQDAFRQDETIKEWEAAVAETREEIARLDLQAGQAENQAELAEIDLARNNLHIHIQKIQKNIEQKKRSLAKEIQATCWPQYQTQLREEVEQLHMEQVKNSSRRDTLALQLKTKQSQIDSIKEELEEYQRDKQTVSARQVSPPVFQPELVLPLAELSQRESWSRLHYAAIILFTLAGGLLGYLVPALYQPKPKEKVKVKAKEKDQAAAVIPIASTAPPTIEGKKLIQTTPIAEPAPKPKPEYLTAIDLNSPVSSIGSTDTAGTVSQAEAEGYGPLIQRVRELRDRIACPVILISSIDPSDSSPRFSVNFGIALARSQFRVLLINTDTGHSELSAIFNIPDGPGFFEWRRGESWTSKVARKTQLTGLTVMAAGTANEEQTDPAIDLNKESHRWKNLSNSYDVVLLYSPAALTVSPQKPEEIAASQLLDLADGLVSLTRKHKNLVRINQQSADSTTNHIINYLGCVILRD